MPEKKTTALHRPATLDADVLRAAFDEFSKKKLTKEKLPSVRKVLSAFKEQAKAISKGREVVKNKDRGIER